MRSYAGTGSARRRIGVALGLVLSACSSALEPTGAGRWAADLIARKQVLSMVFTRSGPAITGSGSLADLHASLGTPLTLSGVQYADTLDITYQRPSGGPFRFVGWYTSQSTIDGTLDGAEFSREPVRFRDR